MNVQQNVKRMVNQLINQGMDRKAAICKVALAHGLTVQTVLNILKTKGNA